MAAGALRHGLAKETGSGRHWSLKPVQVDLFDVKADVFALLTALGVPTGGLQIISGGPGWYHPGRCGTVQLGPKNVIGAFGEIHPRCLEAFSVEGTATGFELLLEDIPVPKLKGTRTKPKLDVPEFMPVQRDFAFLVDRSVRATDIIRAAAASERALITDVGVFDVYEGKGIPDGKKSIAISVTLQPREKTLTEAEIDAVSGKIVAEVAKRTGASLRG